MASWAKKTEKRILKSAKREEARRGVKPPKRQRRVFPQPISELQSTSSTALHAPPDRPEHVETEYISLGDPFIAFPPPTPVVDSSLAPSRHALRREAQSKRWNESVLPRLLPRFLANRAKFFGHAATATPNMHRACSCDAPPARLQVLCVYFDRTESVTLASCPCFLAAEQLVDLGLFPCAPLQPSLAVCLNMLEFASSLFMFGVPNERAWVATLHAFLQKRGFAFTSEDSLRRRFSGCLRQYQLLCRLADAEVKALVQRAQTTLAVQDDNPLTKTDHVSATAPASLIAGPESTGLLSDSITKPIFERDFISASNLGHPGCQPRSVGSDPKSAPSLYLRGRCPLCFGAHSVAGSCLDIIGSIDACFQQKRNKEINRRASEGGDTSLDPQILVPNTVFLSRPFLLEWEERAAGLRRHNTANRQKKADELSDYDIGANISAGPADDYVEPRMRIPKSALDACGESFIAADGDRIKASTKYFADTGLMALLCRHDRVLFVANMWTAGEKQFYALALIDALLKNIPPNWRVGILYDISCQLHRTLSRVDSELNWLERLEFAVSIFHAYGHQWSCQLWYHPRKSSIWGLSDGEGCERFWAELRRLIPVLRPTGYHRRLMILDLQIGHIDYSKMLNVGLWLNDRCRNANERIKNASKGLEDSGFAVDEATIAYLLSEFTAQQQFQSRPIEKQSKKKGIQAVGRLVEAEASEQSLQTSLTQLRGELSRAIIDKISQPVIIDLEEKITTTTDAIESIRRRISMLRRTLSLSADGSLQADYNEIKKSEFLTTRLNVLAIRNQLLAKLRARRFEQSNLDRAYRSRALDRQAQDHIERAMNRRQSGITSSLQRYNTKRNELIRIKGRTPALAKAYIPPEITADGLFQLDVDSNIWLDLEAFDGFPDGKIPKWLGDEKIRHGIRFAQELLSSRQELARCRQEYHNLVHWYQEEYRAVVRAEQDISEPSLKFHLGLVRTTLDQLSLAWKKPLAKAGFPSITMPPAILDPGADLSCLSSPTDTILPMIFANPSPNLVTLPHDEGASDSDSESEVGADQLILNDIEKFQAEESDTEAG